MADDLQHDPPGPPAEPASPPVETLPEPPPLDAIRVKGPRPKGLNKPAIVAAAGGGAAIVLVLASGALTADPSRNPSEARPMMSAPARPEMAKGAIRDLPANYAEAQPFMVATQPAPPQLGPPLPGDIAAFAPDAPHLRGPQEPGWNETYTPQPPTEPDPAEIEAKQADRSGLFFALRDAPLQSAQTSQPDPRLTPTPAPDGQGRPSPALNRTLHPGAVISASLVTEINSESPGPVIAQITQAIHDSATGRVLLIPQGARLIGDYRSASTYGQSRLAIIWSRLIMPDGEEIVLDEAAMDPSGIAGVAGMVDNHWTEVFGAAALGTLINLGVATTEDPQLTYGGVGISRDPVEAAITDGVQRGASIVTNRVVDRSLAIPPTIRIEAGKRISVIVTRRTGF